MRGAVAILSLTACGRLGFGGHERADAAAGEAPPPDVAVDGPVDAPGIDAPFVCGALPQIADDFADGIIEAAKWNAFGDPGTSVTEIGGLARIALADDAAGMPYAQFISRCTYDARGHGVSVRSVTRPRTAPGAEASLCLSHFGAQAQQMCVDYSNGLMLAVYNDGTGGLVRASRAIGPNDVYWRVAEQGGTVLWQTSADAISWSTLHSEVAPADMSAVKVELFGGTFQPVMAPGIAEFDDLAVQ